MQQPTQWTPLSTTNPIQRPPLAASPMQDWHEVGIVLPPGATGNVRTRCPQCSASRRKSQEPCLSVQADTGLWYCWHCGWKGALHGQSADVSRPADRLARRHQATPRQGLSRGLAVKRIWQASRPSAAGDPVDLYLHQRGLAFRPLSRLPAVLRCHPRLVRI